MEQEEKDQESTMEESPEETPEKPPEVQVPPPKPELQIIDFSRKRINPYCIVCGMEKDRYLEVETNGVIEYTCKSCYAKSHLVPVSPTAISCGSCGAPMAVGDNFCGKCGVPAILRCVACNNEVDEEDRFCAKYGAKLFPAD